MAKHMRALFIVVAGLAVSCGSEIGVCEIDGACGKSQRNTCESGGGKWTALKDVGGMDAELATCHSLGYKNGRAPHFTK